MPPLPRTYSSGKPDRSGGVDAGRAVATRDERGGVGRHRCPLTASRAGPASGSLWNIGHINALEAAEEEFPQLETETRDEVAASDSGQLFTTFAEEGYDMIIGANFNYGDVLSRISTEYPETKFEVAGGVQQSKLIDNMGIFCTRFYEASYLAGIAAGMMTESDTLGYVTPFPIPTTLRRVNAFALGAASVNPNVTQKVRYTNAWYDLGAASQAVEALIDQGADVINSGTDSRSPIETARDNETLSVGMYVPEMAEAGGEYYISGALCRWETPYQNAISSGIEGDWEAEWRWDGIQQGFVDIDEWGPPVPQEVKDEVAPKYEAARNGELDYWAGSKFEGESDETLYNEMSSYVDIIEGEVPN